MTSAGFEWLGRSGRMAVVLAGALVLALALGLMFAAGPVGAAPGDPGDGGGDGGDTIAPDTSLNVGPPSLTNQTSATFTYSATEAPATFECRLDTPTSTGTFSACGGPTSATTDQVSKSYSGLTTNGTYTFYVKATDESLNTDTTPASRSWTIDTVAPGAPTINMRPPELVNTRTASWTFSSEPGATFQCSIDSTTNFSACSSGHDFSVSSDGSHTFRVKAKDQVGNISQNFASHTWTVDTKKPTVLRGFTPTGTGVSPKAKPTVKFSEKMNKASVVASKNGKPTTFFLKKGRTTVAATVKYVETATGQYKAIMTPASPLRSGVTYTATVSTAAKDLAGNALAKAKTWTFTVK